MGSRSICTPRACPAGAGTRCRERRANHQERVARLHHLLRRLRAQKPDRAGGVGAIVGDGGLAEERLGDGRGQRVGRTFQKVRRADRALAREDRDLRPGVQHLGRARELVLVGSRALRANASEVCPATLPSTRSCASPRAPAVDGERQVRDAAVRERGATGEVRPRSPRASAPDPRCISRRRGRDGRSRCPAAVRRDEVVERPARDSVAPEPDRTWRRRGR